jgi:hypothetical protein
LATIPKSVPGEGNLPGSGLLAELHPALDDQVYHAEGRVLDSRGLGEALPRVAKDDRTRVDEREFFPILLSGEAERERLSARFAPFPADRFIEPDWAAGEVVVVGTQKDLARDVLTINTYDLYEDEEPPLPPQPYSVEGDEVAWMVTTLLTRRHDFFLTCYDADRIVDKSDFESFAFHDGMFLVRPPVDEEEVFNILSSCVSIGAGGGVLALEEERAPKQCLAFVGSAFDGTELFLWFGAKHRSEILDLLTQRCGGWARFGQ